MNKLFEATIILNWKNGGVRVVKKKPRGLNPFEILVKMKIKVKVPEMKEIIAKGEIEIPEHKVNQMVLESL